MKKYGLLCLMFFLFFVFQFRPAFSLSTGQCRYYIDGMCITEDGFYSEEIPGTTEGVIIGETHVPETLREVSGPSMEFATEMLAMVFQFFGILVLFVLLVVMIEELTRSGK